MKLDNFKRQHTELIQLASDLQEKARASRTSGASEDAAKALIKLAGTLRVHLSMEDDSLYPLLLESSSAEVVATARRFQDEMGGLAATFDDYKQRWSARAIGDDTERFAVETEEIVNALGQRINREDEQLYTLVSMANSS